MSMAAGVHDEPPEEIVDDFNIRSPRARIELDDVAVEGLVATVSALMPRLP